jgi:hypothetical protein
VSISGVSLVKLKLPLPLPPEAEKIDDARRLRRRRPLRSRYGCAHRGVPL